MIAAALIAFREGLEAALIVGIVFGYLKKTGQQAHYRYAWAGVLAAIGLSLALALGIQAIGMELQGPAEQLFEGITMFLAVGILTWMIFWMRYQSRTLKSTLEHDLQRALRTDQRRGVLAATFLAVIREGVETALFLSAAAFATSGSETLIGALAGLIVAAVVGVLIYASTVRLNLRLFFNVTSVLLLLFAAGMLARGIHEFQEAGVIPMVIEHVWDTNALLDEGSTGGELLKAVLGYNATPSLLEVIGYWAYWALAFFGVRGLVDRKIALTAKAAQAV